MQRCEQQSGSPAGGKAEAGSERRRAPRLRALKEARVMTSGSTTVDCTIRDLSATGAKLAFAGPTPMPEEFRLLMKATNLLVPARLVWQRGLFAGVAFLGQPAMGR